MKHRKSIRILSALLALTLLLAITPQLTLTAHAAETSGKCGDNLTWSFDAGSGTLTISGYGEMYNVGASIDYSDPNEPHYIPDTPWFGYAKQITEIRLQEGLISIGSGAFAGCSRLRNVTLPNSLTTIGSSAFRECSSLQSVSISDGVIDIYPEAFYKCTSLRSVTIPRNVEYISGSAFSYCTSLSAFTVAADNPYFCAVDGILFSKDKTTLDRYPIGKPGSTYTVPDYVTYIDYAAFEGCRGLQSISLPDSVTEIGDCAFNECSSLQNITIPDSVTEIGYAVFSNCSGLLGVTIPDSVTKIGREAFSKCASLQSVTIPNSVTSIDGEAFQGCINLASISILGKIEFMGSYAFFDTAYAQNPNNWSNGLLYLGNWVIASCGLTSATIRPGTFGIAGDAFTFTSDTLKSVTIPEDLEYIGTYAFGFCRQLSSIDLPDSIRHIDYGAFDYTAIYDDPNRWDHGLFYVGNWLIDADDNITAANVRPGTRGIACSAFSVCKNLTDVTLPKDLRFIGENAFSFCDKLRNILIPNSVETIGTCAFTCCSGLRSVSLPKQITEIDEGVFSECTSLTEIKIPNSVTSIGGGAFSGCSSLKNLTIPNSVTSIGESAFDGCSSLTNLAIPNSVKTIDEWAFAGCSSLKAVIVPDSVTSIGEDAFGWNDNLRSILILNKDCDIYDSENTLNYPEHTTVFGYPGSTAEAYAQKYGYTFKSIEDVSFIDVADNVYYTNPVAWAVEREVTNGTAPYLFSPENTCTRAQVVTFLWRAAGCPEPKQTANPFEDVKEGQYYYKAVLWAAEQGVTNGVDAKHFAPNAGCTRGQVVTFLWRAMGKPASKSADNPFKDVTVQQYYYQAVLWAAEAGVTNGTSADKFSPESTCTRGQIVTFLYRAMNSNWEPGDPNLGLYRATLVEMNGLQVNADEIFKEGFLIELRDRGVCKIYGEGQSSMGSWSLGNGTFTIHENEATISGTLSNGVIKLINMFGNGLDITLKRQS